MRDDRHQHRGAGDARLLPAGAVVPVYCLRRYRAGEPLAQAGYIENPQGSNRMKRIALAALLAFSTSTALAFHCPADMRKIDEAMAKNPKLSTEQAAEVKKYRAEGETLHKAGKHQDSVDTLAKAMKILNIK
jgi:hypothetical protein